MRWIRNKWAIVFLFSLLLNSYFIARDIRRAYIQKRLLDTLRADYRERRAELFRETPTARRGIILAGDSLTEEGLWSELLPSPQLIKRGINGAGVGNFLRDIELLISPEPRKIFLLLGINDLWRKQENSLEQYKELLEKLRTRLPHTKVFVLSLLPVNTKLFDVVGREEIADYNQKLSQICQELGVDYLDLHAKLSDSNGELPADFTQDGIHLNAKAYKIWAEFLRPYL